jgi:integrase
MASIIYRLLSNSDNAQIYLRLSIAKGKSFRRKTGLSINPKNWSDDTHLPKQNIGTNKATHTRLRKLKDKILDNLEDANSKGVEVTGDWLKHQIDLHFKRVSENKQSDLLTDAIQTIVDTANIRPNAKGGIGISMSRIKAYSSFKKIIEVYQTHNKEIYKVKDVNVKFANNLLNYLLNKKHYSKSYSLKKIADLKTVCFNAELDGIKTDTQLKKIKSPKSDNENIIYLTPTELKKIENANILNPSLQNARKWLLLGCNIGQRGGDLLDLTENNFVNRNGLDVIELKQQKTGKNVTIPVLPTTKEILKEGLPYKISIQKLNNQIKDVCEIAKLNTLTKGKAFDEVKKRVIEGEYPKHMVISTHVCRRSFATNQYGNLPTVLIMQITGHSTERMLLNYVGKDSLDYAQQIADFYTLQSQKEKKEPQLTIVKKASN